MKQMKTYTKIDFHNPEQLTRQQVGAEYRLLLNDELLSARSFGDEIELNIDGYWAMAAGDSRSVTYRVPLATPLPNGTVLSSNECCFSDAPAKPRLYLAGPMSSHPDDFNFPAFFKASKELEEQGYEVLNPAQMDLDCGWTIEKLRQLDESEFQEFLEGAVNRDLDAIQMCQAIAMLPGWESSKGAKAELAVAQWLGLDEVYLEDVKQPYNSDERAEWNNDSGKIDMGDYSSTATAQYAADDPKGAAGAKKAPMHLLPPDALIEIAKVMGEGARKYQPWNFIAARVCASTYIGAILRHWAEFAKGRDMDDGAGGSGLSHLSHIAANCMILLTAKQQGTLNDDRPKLK